VTKSSKASLNITGRFFKLPVLIVVGLLILAVGSLLIQQSPVTKTSGRLAALSEHLNYDTILSHLIIRTAGTTSPWCTKILVTPSSVTSDGNDNQECLVKAFNTVEINNTAVTDTGSDTEQRINTKATNLAMPSIVPPSVRVSHTAAFPEAPIALESNKGSQDSDTLAIVDSVVIDSKPIVENMPAIDNRSSIKKIAHDSIAAVEGIERSGNATLASESEILDKKSEDSVRNSHTALSIDDQETTETANQIEATVAHQSAGTVNVEPDRLNSKSFATSLFANSYKYPLLGLSAEPLSTSEEKIESIDMAEHEGLEKDFPGFLHIKNPQPLVVMIDPGHGGSDTGTIGAEGSLEKHVTLDIAKRIRTLASLYSDIDIVLTRDDDIGMSRQSRIDTIAAQNPDLLISIHLNSLPQSNITLVETYYASDADMLLAKLHSNNIQQNHTALGKMHSGRSTIDRRQRGILSHDLANLVQSAVFSTVQSHNPRAIDAGVKSDSLFVLTGSNVPGVLIEMTCLSNAEEASRLETESYRTELAETLMRAIRQFAEKHNQTDKLALKQLDKATKKGT